MLYGEHRDPEKPGHRWYKGQNCVRLRGALDDTTPGGSGPGLRHFLEILSLYLMNHLC